MKLSGNWQVLIDCSTFLSGAFYPKGKPRKILELWRDEKYQLVVSHAIIEEYEIKISPVAQRMKKDTFAGVYYLDLIKTEAVNVTSAPIDSRICRDPNDLKYLEAALACQADFLISSDKDLLELRKFEKTKIVSPDQFLKIFSRY